MNYLKIIIQNEFKKKSHQSLKGLKLTSAILLLQNQTPHQIPSNDSIISVIRKGILFTITPNTIITDSLYKTAK
jgi:hypothetical protein